MICAKNYEKLSKFVKRYSQNTVGPLFFQTRSISFSSNVDLRVTYRPLISPAPHPVSGIHFHANPTPYRTPRLEDT